jgi:type IV pilus assembly protein PilM
VRIGKERVSLAVQVTNRVLRVLELGKDRRPTFEPVEVSLDGADKLETFRRIVNERGLSGKSAITCLSVDDALMKFYKYPASMSSKDLQNAIDWSIKRELSAIREETLHDYYILEKRPEDKHVGVILVLSRKETVDNLKRMFESVGIKLAIIDFEIVATVNYGLYFRLPVPFSILYMDYNYSTLTTYSPMNVSYSVFHWGYGDFLKSQDEESIEGFFAEVRNIIVLNDLSSMYIAGPILGEEDLLTRVMENLPVLGLLDVEGIKPNFFLPYILSIRGMEE